MLKNFTNKLNQSSKKKKQANNKEWALWDQRVKNQNRRLKTTRARQFMTRYCLHIFYPDACMCFLELRFSLFTPLDHTALFCFVLFCLL